MLSRQASDKAQGRKPRTGSRPVTGCVRSMGIWGRDAAYRIGLVCHAGAKPSADEELDLILPDDMGVMRRCRRPDFVGMAGLRLSGGVAGGGSAAMCHGLSLRLAIGGARGWLPA